MLDRKELLFRRAILVHNQTRPERIDVLRDEWLENTYKRNVVRLVNHDATNAGYVDSLFSSQLIGTLQPKRFYNITSIENEINPSFERLELHHSKSC